MAFIDEVLAARRLWSHNHALAWRSAERLTARWGLPWSTPRAMVGSMVSLPLPAVLGRGTEAAAALKDWLLYERAIEAQILAIDDGLWLRISAQAYVDDEDIERLAAAIDERIVSR
jgi:isopenicillin-N epimerase